MPTITADTLMLESDKLYAYALKRVRNHHQAQDLVQDKVDFKVAMARRSSSSG